VSTPRRLAIPRSSSSRAIMPASMVLPTPTSSAIKSRTGSSRRAMISAGALGAVVLFPGLGHAEDATAKIDNFTFTPARLTVKAGTTVTWRNEDDIPHTVTSATRLFKSKALDTDDSFSLTFTEPGTYEYFCSLHPRMTGTIVVEPGNAEK
jgi:plastocyanin